MSQANPFGIPGLEGAPGANPMLQGLDMMAKAWSGMSAGPFGPGFKPEDLDKRIAELRVVENWLRVNQAMLQSTIQGLEVQRATIATLQTFFTPGGKPGDKPAVDATAPMQAWWNMVQEQFGRIAKAAATPAPAAPEPQAARPASTGTTRSAAAANPAPSTRQRAPRQPAAAKKSGDPRP